MMIKSNERKRNRNRDVSTTAIRQIVSGREYDNGAFRSKSTSPIVCRYGFFVYQHPAYQYSGMLDIYLIGGIVRQVYKS